MDTLQSASTDSKIRAKRRRNFFFSFYVSHDFNTTPVRVGSYISIFLLQRKTRRQTLNQRALYYHLLAHVLIYANGFLRHNYHDVSQTYETHFSIKAQDDLLLFHNRMCLLDKFELEKTVTLLDVCALDYLEPSISMAKTTELWK